MQPDIIDNCERKLSTLLCELLTDARITKLPIPTPSASDRSAIEALVSSCLSKRGAGCEAEEGEINARVAKLYGL